MQILRNMTWWLDGRSLHMEVEELTPANIKDKMEEVYAAGQQIELALGLEKLEMKAKLTTINGDVLAKQGIAPGRRMRSTFRGQTVDELNGQSRAVIITAEHRISGETDNWKTGEKAGIAYTLNGILYYKYQIEERVIHEIDPPNFVRIVDGVDQLADARNALGIGF